MPRIAASEAHSEREDLIPHMDYQPIRNSWLFRPDVAYAALWVTVLLLTLLGYVSPFFNTAYIVKPNEQIIQTLLITVLTGFVLFFIIEKFVPSNKGSSSNTISIDFQLLFRIQILIFSFWIAGYCLNIAASGGLPVLWRFSGSEKTYVDYGLPTFTGFLNSFRLFLVASLIISFHKDKHARSTCHILPLVIVLISPILEFNRGGFVQTISYAALAFLSCRTLNFRTVSITLAATILILTATFLIGAFRYGATVNSSIHHFLPPYPNSVFFYMPEQVFWCFAYLTTPLNNLFYMADHSTPTMQLINTIYPLVPSVFRATAFSGNDLTQLTPPRVEFTAVTQYGPLFQDFGTSGILIYALFIQAMSSVAYIRAKNGDYLSNLIYIGLLSSLLLGFFYNYYLSLVTIAYFGISWLICKIAERN